MDNLILICQQLYQCMPRFRRLTGAYDANVYNWTMIDQINRNMKTAYDQLITEPAAGTSQEQLLLITHQLLQFHPDRGDDRPWHRASAAMDRLEDWLRLHNRLPQP